MDKLATMDTIGSSFRPWLSCQGICLLNRHQTGDTDSVQPVILLPVQRDSQETFIPCEARMLWYSADRTSSQQLRDTTLLPTIDTIFAHTIQPCRRVDADPFCEGGNDLYHEGNGRFQLGNGRMASLGKRPCTGGTMVQGPGDATLNGIGALGLDALPVTIGTSYGGQCHTLLLATRIGLCGGA